MFLVTLLIMTFLYFAVGSYITILIVKVLGAAKCGFTEYAFYIILWPMALYYLITEHAPRVFEEIKMCKIITKFFDSFDKNDKQDPL